MVARSAATKPGEIGFGASGAGAVDAVAILMVDPLHAEAGAQCVPGRAFISVHSGAMGGPQPDGDDGVRLGGKYLCQGPAAAPMHRHDNFSLARLVLSEPAVDPLCGQVVGRTWPPK
jgi:hypothetical protein